MTKNIMIVGVGGQGSLLASKLLGHVLLSQNYDVKVSEVHGMSAMVTKCIHRSLTKDKQMLLSLLKN